MIDLTGWWNWGAESEGVTSETSVATTRREMIDNLAQGILATGAWARVQALIPKAGSIGRAIGVHRAFWTATFVRVADVLGQTHTRTSSVSLLTQGIASTWRGIAGVENFGQHILLDVALEERISEISWRANAVWCVAHHSAFGV